MLVGGLGAHRKSERVLSIWVDVALQRKRRYVETNAFEHVQPPRHSQAEEIRFADLPGLLLGQHTYLPNPVAHHADGGVEKAARKIVTAVHIVHADAYLGRNGPRPTKSKDPAAQHEINWVSFFNKHR